MAPTRCVYAHLAAIVGTHSRGTLTITSFDASDCWVAALGLVKSRLSCSVRAWGKRSVRDGQTLIWSSRNSLSPRRLRRRTECAPSEGCDPSALEAASHLFRMPPLVVVEIPRPRTFPPRAGESARRGPLSRLNSHQAKADHLAVPPDEAGDVA